MDLSNFSETEDESETSSDEEEESNNMSSVATAFHSKNFRTQHMIGFNEILRLEKTRIRQDKNLIESIYARDHKMYAKIKKRILKHNYIFEMHHITEEIAESFLRQTNSAIQTRMILYRYAEMYLSGGLKERYDVYYENIKDHHNNLEFFIVIAACLIKKGLTGLRSLIYLTNKMFVFSRDEDHYAVKIPKPSDHTISTFIVATYLSISVKCKYRKRESINIFAMPKEMTVADDITKNADLLSLLWIIQNCRSDINPHWENLQPFLHSVPNLIPFGDALNTYLYENRIMSHSIALLIRDNVNALLADSRLTREMILSAKMFLLSNLSPNVRRKVFVGPQVAITA